MSYPTCSFTSCATTGALQWSLLAMQTITSVMVSDVNFPFADFKVTRPIVLRVTILKNMLVVVVVSEVGLA